jgi:hypothetical protein
VPFVEMATLIARDKPNLLPTVGAKDINKNPITRIHALVLSPVITVERIKFALTTKAFNLHFSILLVCGF